MAHFEPGAKGALLAAGTRQSQPAAHEEAAAGKKIVALLWNGSRDSGNSVSYGAFVK